MLFAIVPDAPPTRKNQRATSCPAPISANVPYFDWSRLICSAFWCVLTFSFFIRVKVTAWEHGGETEIKVAERGCVADQAQRCDWCSAHIRASKRSNIAPLQP